MTATGAEILRLAKTHIGERYVLGARAPKDNHTYFGPWDCAEFASWLVFQASGLLFGCEDDDEAPATADAYTGAWGHDVRTIGKLITVAAAAGTPGSFLLRHPIGAKFGHVAVSDGRGGTVEARSSRGGVCAAKVFASGESSRPVLTCCEVMAKRSVSVTFLKVSRGTGGWRSTASALYSWSTGRFGLLWIFLDRRFQDREDTLQSRGHLVLHRAHADLQVVLALLRGARRRVA